MLCFYSLGLTNSICSDVFREVNRRMSMSVESPISKQEEKQVEKGLSTWNDIFGKEVIFFFFSHFMDIK